MEGRAGGALESAPLAQYLHTMLTHKCIEQVFRVLSAKIPLTGLSSLGSTRSPFETSREIHIRV
jgi:hypothetical protein